MNGITYMVLMTGLMDMMCGKLIIFTYSKTINFSFIINFYRDSEECKKFDFCFRVKNNMLYCKLLR